MKRVEVIWQDAAALQYGWASRGSYGKRRRKATINKSLGYLARDHREYVVLVMTDGGTGQVNQGFHIPRGSIVRVRRLRVEAK